MKTKMTTLALLATLSAGVIAPTQALATSDPLVTGVWESDQEFCMGLRFLGAQAAVDARAEGIPKDYMVNGLLKYMADESEGAFTRQQKVFKLAVVHTIDMAYRINPQELRTYPKTVYNTCMASR